MTDFYAQPGRDGRRKSDPLRNPQTGPTIAPEYHLNRLVTANDAAAGTGQLTTKAHGINCDAARYVGLIVTPLTTPAQIDEEAPALGSSTVVIEILFWNPILKRFVNEYPLVTFTGGAGESFAYSFDAKGRHCFVRVTGVAGGEAVAIHATTYDIDRTL